MDDSTVSTGLSTAQGAASGAAAGSVVPGVGTAIGAGLGATLGLVGGLMGSSAAKKAAQAQQDAAQRWMRYVQGEQDKAISMVKSPAQMAAYDLALKSQETTVRRQETLAQSLDPTLVEAGKQTAQLLKGQSAPVLQNIQTQRNVQRQQMMDNLRQQMGPGAETSTAGQQAMAAFDLQTSNLMNTAQQQYLDKVSNLSIGGTESLGQSLSKVNQTLSTMNTQSPDAQAADLIAKFTGAQAGAQTANVEAAGGKYVGQMIEGQTIAGLGKNLSTLAGAFYGNNSQGTQSAAPGQPAGQPTTLAAGGDSFDPQKLGFPPQQGSLASAVRQPAPGMAGGSSIGGADVGVPSSLSRSGPGYYKYNTPDGMSPNLPWSSAGVSNMFNPSQRMAEQ